MDKVIVEQGRASMDGFIEPQTIQDFGNTLDHMDDWVKQRDLHCVVHWWVGVISCNILWIIIDYLTKYLWLMIGPIGNYWSSFQINAQLYGLFIALED